jgi:predicted nucleotidyltransferase component of viral defense system
MDKIYADTVRLLLRCATDVFKNDCFAMKGGTAINLFVRNMPRLSVDIDVVYTPWAQERNLALRTINQEIQNIAHRLERMGLACRTVRSRDMGDTKLVIEDGNVQVKVEVKTVFRGCVKPVMQRVLCSKTSAMFNLELTLPTLAPAELYGSKLVAALDRQHPRDLFDVCKMFDADTLTDETTECFVTYLAGHNRPVHEVLFGRDKVIDKAYNDNFLGMTEEAVPLDALLNTRARLRDELPAKLTDSHRKFLIMLTRAQPDYRLLRCPHAEYLPALRWKLENLKIFKRRRPADFESQARSLEKLFDKL